MDEGERERRQTLRQRVLLAAQLVRPAGGAATKHNVRDLSASGARIDQAGGLTVGSTVRLSIGGLTAVTAVVVWIRNDFAGLHFAQPIDTDAARSHAAIPARRADEPQPLGRRAKRDRLAGWVKDLQSPYGKTK